MADLDLLALAARYGIALQRRGAHYVARCPFHTERTPSFKIRADRPTRWRCYGACATGGDGIDLVGRLRFGPAWNPRDRAQFRAVSRELALDTLPARLPQPAPPAPAFSAEALAVLDQALQLYETELWARGGGRGTPLRYLRARGFTDDTLRHQRIGYCSGAGLRTTLESSGCPVEGVDASGLLPLRGAAGPDRVEALRGRIVIPDLDAHGRARYLTGRAWAPWLRRGAKYLSLRSVPPPLYGWASLPAGRSPVLVTESLADWLTLRQWGCPVLATGGTGLSTANARLLRDLDRPLVFVVQNDDPGRAAAARWQRAVGRGRLLHPPGPMKDVNDVLVAGLEPVFRAALAALLSKEAIVSNARVGSRDARDPPADARDPPADARDP